MTTKYNIVLAQINPTVGDLKNNTKKILNIIKNFYLKTDLIIFPELSLVGYPPEDLILRDKLIDEANICLKKIHNYLEKKKIAVIIGTPMKLNNGIGNAAVYIKGKTKKAVFKNNLPNYGVFDEKRVFLKGPLYKCINFKSIRIGIMICEDIWTKDIYEKLIKDKADLFICINASPYDNKKQIQRIEVARKLVTASKKYLIYVNQIGGQDELVFDGGSFVMDPEGEIKYQMDFWKELTNSIELKFNNKKKIVLLNKKIKKPYSYYFNTWNALVLGLKDYVKKNSFKKVVLGLSGGIDSAVSAAIAVDALGNKNVIGLRLPSKLSSKGSLIDAEETIRLLNIDSNTIKINNIIDQYIKILKNKFENKLLNITNENLQSRIRGSLLMAYSNNFSYLLLSTGNKSELSVGYSTIYGDMNGGFNVLKDIYKTDLYKLANWRNKLEKNIFKGSIGRVIPENSINKEPSAELSLNQKDSDALPNYNQLDQILYYFIEREFSIEQICKRGFPIKTVKKIRSLILLSEYKRRQAPPGVKLSSRAFGKERRYPITNKFKL